MDMNLPNLLTLSRVAFIPVLVVVFYTPFQYHLIAAAGIFTLASITDAIDGYVARRLGQITQFGAFLDPVADKLMVAVALILLVERHDSLYFTLPASVIIGREIVISALREWMAEIGKSASVAVSYIGKVKTGLQMTAIVLLLAVDDILLFVPEAYSIWIFTLSYTLLYGAAILTLWSMILYLRTAMREFDVK